MEHLETVENVKARIDEGPIECHFRVFGQSYSIKLKKTGNQVNFSLQKKHEIDYNYQDILHCSLISLSRPYMAGRILFHNYYEPFEKYEPYIENNALVFQILFKESQFTPIYDDPESSDLIVRVGQREFYLHKCIVCHRSPVFHVMMKSGMIESQTSTVEISDFCELCVDAFLRYLYYGEKQLSEWTEWCELLLMARKYDVKTLEIVCERTLLDKDDPEYEILKFAIDHDCRYLKTALFIKIRSLLRCSSFNKRKFVEAFEVKEGLSLMSRLIEPYK